MSNFILASASPRRSELLKKLVANFEIAPVEVDETLQTGQSAREETVRLATAKSRASHRPGATTLGVDTLGQLGDELFGKPADQNAARELLLRLSDATHTVVSGFCVKTDQTEKTGFAATKVTFRPLSFFEIEDYLAGCDATQFAGGYAIQAAGRKFVEKIDGELETVIGLPVRELAEVLKSLRE